MLILLYGELVFSPSFVWFNTFGIFFSPQFWKIFYNLVKVVLCKFPLVMLLELMRTHQTCLEAIYLESLRSLLKQSHPLTRSRCLKIKIYIYLRKRLSILAGNLNSSRSYLITTVKVLTWRRDFWRTWSRQTRTAWFLTVTRTARFWTVTLRWATRFGRWLRKKREKNR